ncbi:MAG: aspartate aminotransferase family protein [Sphingomonadaceae bacterium]
MTNWTEIERWDRSYYLHNVQAGPDFPYVGVDRQDGNWITLANGDRLLDFQSQLISDSLGHRNSGIYNEIRRAMDRYGHVFFGMGNLYRARAAKLIIEDVLGPSSPNWAGRVRILASGTEAVENAIVAARLYTGRQIVLTQAHSFHGTTVGSSMLRGYRNNFTPAGDSSRVRDVPGFPVPGYIPVPPPERADFTVASGAILPSLAATEAIIRAVSPENIAAIITEPMFGAGGLWPHPDYMPGIRALSRKYGFLWIDDEVLCGFGRLGEWFGYQLAPDIHPDLMIVGKSINGSALPSGAMITSHEIGQFLDEGRWWSGSTWDGHPLVCASIVGGIETMLRENIPATVRARGNYLRARLDAMAARHPCVGHVGGAGLYHVLDLVDGQRNPIVAEDRWSAFLGDTQHHPNNIVARECAARGVFLGGFVPNTIKVGPPFTITEAEIDLAMNALDAALDVVDSRFC